MKVQLLDRYLRKKPHHIQNIFFPEIPLDRIRIDSIKTLTINLLKIYSEKENIIQYFEWSIFDFDHKLEYRACKELVKEDKLVEVKKWYSLKRRFRLKTTKDFRKEKLDKISKI